MTSPEASDPVMLHYEPHPVHRKMGEAIDAEFVQCRTGGIRDRMAGALTHDFGNRPVILEGGVPLTEGMFSKLAGRAEYLIALGADSTYHDMVDPLPFRDRGSRLAHRIAQRYVDGTLAVSDDIGSIASRMTSAPVRISHPFIETDRYEKLARTDPDLNNREILCLGKYRPKNGQDLLVEALAVAEKDVTVHFVGPDTEQITEGPNRERHGFLPEDDLMDLFDICGLMVFPALSGAFPVATLEGLRAGLPVLTTTVVGTVTCVRPVSNRLITEPAPEPLADAIDWYYSVEPNRRVDLADRSCRVGRQFDEATGIDNFVNAYNSVIERL